MNKRFGLRYTAIKITLLIALLMIAALVAGCGSTPEERAENHWDELDSLWEKTAKSKDWDMGQELRVVEPHGDSDGAESYDQKYYVNYTSKKVPDFKIISFIEIPAADSRPLKERANGYFNLQTDRLEGLPDSQGFMKLVATEHKELALTSFIEDGTLAEKYPGKQVYRLLGRNWDTLPHTNTPRIGNPRADPFVEDWPKVFAETKNTSGPLVGYDDKTKKWETLEPGK